MNVLDHVIHTKTRTQYQDDPHIPIGYFTPAGQILKNSLGRDMFIIGMTYGSGHFWKNWQRPSTRYSRYDDLLSHNLLGIRRFIEKSN